VTYLYIIAGAVIGAPLRYYIQGKIQDMTSPAFPWGTLVVNVTGCLVIGLLATLAEERGTLNREGRLLFITGFLGSYTTFSSFGLETYNLAKESDMLRAAGNVILSVCVGLAAVWAGAIIARGVAR
jgi:CrcB protein